MAADQDALRPLRLGARGAALWEALTKGKVSVSVERRVLAGEASRLADRLDRLDELLAGDIDTWMRLTHRLMTEDYELKIDSAASEARQTAAALRQILSQLAEGAAPAVGGSIADELDGRRAARQADAAS